MTELIDQSPNSFVPGRRLWSGVSRHERRRIQKEVKNDDLLRDPDEAEKLVEVAGRRRLKWRRPGRLYLIALLVLIGLQVAVLVLDLRGGRWFSVLLAVYLIGEPAWRYVDHRRWWDRWERAEARHVEYLEQLGLPAWRRPAD